MELDVNKHDVCQEGSGPVQFETWYSFTQGGPVEKGTLRFPVDQPAPFEIARWSIEPGTANDRDVHVSRELWLVIAGVGRVTWGASTHQIGPGDVIGFETHVPHQVRNVGTEPLRVFSIYWKPSSNEAGPAYDVGSNP